MEMARAKTPAISICGFFERSNLESDAFSGSASANAMAVLESSCVSDKFKLCKHELRVRAFFNAKIYSKELVINLTTSKFSTKLTPSSVSCPNGFIDRSNTSKQLLSPSAFDNNDNPS